MQKGLLLVNLGTPNNCGIWAVGSYLLNFLLDYRVIRLPALLRYLLVCGLIVPTRTKRSAKAYQAIWTDGGSPLLVNSQNLTTKLQAMLCNTKVALGMRYGNPSITKALESLQDCDSLIILPLYPQYSSAVTGTSLEQILTLLAKQDNIPNLTVIKDFYDHPAFIKAQAAQIDNYHKNNDFLLLSYHGIPENHPDAIEYKQQCEYTSQHLAESLNLSTKQYTMAFQSRLGKTKWIGPYTDHMLIELAARGITRLTIACPSFVTDCLETLEEIGLRAARQWQKLGGERLTLVPSLNTAEPWLNAILEITNLFACKEN